MNPKWHGQPCTYNGLFISCLRPSLRIWFLSVNVVSFALATQSWLKIWYSSSRSKICHGPQHAPTSLVLHKPRGCSQLSLEPVYTLKSASHMRPNV